MWCDAQRRVVERCDAPKGSAEARRVADRDVDKSYASHRPSQHGWSRGDFKTALLP